MNTLFETVRSKTNPKEIIEDLPVVLINGRSLIPKKSTVKVFNEIIDKFGTLSHYSMNPKKVMRFFIETPPHNILPMINQLKSKNCLTDESIMDNRTAKHGDLSILMLLIIVQIK